MTHAGLPGLQQYEEPFLWAFCCWKRLCIFEQEHSMQAVCMDDLGMNRSQSWHPYSQWVHMHAQVKSPCHNQKNSQGTHRVMSSRQGYQSFSQKKNGTCQQYSAAWKNLKAIQSQAWNSRSRHSCPWGWARNQRAIPTCSCRRKSRDRLRPGVGRW